MLHRRFANATQAPLCKSNWQKLENMKNEPNNTLDLMWPLTLYLSGLWQGLDSQKTITKKNITCTLRLDYALKRIHQILGSIFNTIENVGLCDRIKRENLSFRPLTTFTSETANPNFEMTIAIQRDEILPDLTQRSKSLWCWKFPKQGQIPDNMVCQLQQRNMCKLSCQLVSLHYKAIVIQCESAVVDHKLHDLKGGKRARIVRSPKVKHYIFTQPSNQYNIRRHQNQQQNIDFDRGHAKKDQISNVREIQSSHFTWVLYGQHLMLASQILY